MKITSFEPLIATPADNIDSVLSIFEALGFESRHRKETQTGVKETDSTVISMKNEDGFKLSVMGSQMVSKDVPMIRMNVSNMEEAQELLRSKGFTEVGSGAEPTSKACMMAAPSGFIIAIIEHIK